MIRIKHRQTKSHEHIDASRICRSFSPSHQSSTAKVPILLILHIIEDVPLNASAVTLVHLRGAVLAAELREFLSRPGIAHNRLAFCDAIVTNGTATPFLRLRLRRFHRSEVGHPLRVVLAGIYGQEGITDKGGRKEVHFDVKAEVSITQEDISYDHEEINEHASGVVLLGKLCFAGLGLLSVVDAGFEVVPELLLSHGCLGLHLRKNADVLDLLAQEYAQVLNGVLDHFGDLKFVP